MARRGLRVSRFGDDELSESRRAREASAESLAWGRALDNLRCEVGSEFVNVRRALQRLVKVSSEHSLGVMAAQIVKATQERDAMIAKQCEAIRASSGEVLALKAEVRKMALDNLALKQAVEKQVSKRASAKRRAREVVHGVTA